MYQPWYNRRQVSEEIQQAGQNSFTYHVSSFIVKFAPVGENLAIRKYNLHIKLFIYRA